ncbi:GAP family protein [Mycobacterium lehmannii]|uniref:GAP family protein n=1 Tax=Mycobacterium lehmannii TaxID=2048550 RepID=UPI000B944971|nr:GAP family protein [Mycobacterium lehmannii]
MWGELVGVGLAVSLNPVLLSVILLVLSRPRPVPNLLAFWLGCLIANIPTYLGFLLLLHLVPGFASTAEELAGSDSSVTVKPLQLVVGSLALLVAAAIAWHLWRRRTAPSSSKDSGESEPGVSRESGRTPVSTRSPSCVRNLVDKVESAFRRLLARGRDAWENGALWVALVVGLGYFPPPPLVALIGTVIVGSAATLGAQILASIVFVVMTLAVLEIALLSYVVSPARTAALLRPLHNWSEVHREHVLLALFAGLGIWQLAIGAGIVT